MKTKLIVELHKSGDYNNRYTTFIAAHNEGVTTLSIESLKLYAQSEKKLNPDKNIDAYKDSADDSLLYISEDGGKTFTMTIQLIRQFPLIPQSQHH